MKKNTVISLLLIVLTTSCSSIRYFRYISKGKAPKGTFRTEIPFDFKDNLIVIKVKLNDSDKEFEFMVDSGAPVSVIYKEALAESKADTVMTYNVGDSQGNTAQSHFVMLNVAIGNTVFKDIFTAYSEPAEVLKCIAPGGIIGADLMQTANWEIDFRNKKLIVSDLKSSLPDLKDYQKVRCSKRAPFGSMPWLAILPGLTVDLEIKGEKFRDVYVDSGFNGALALPKNKVTDTLFKNDLKEVSFGYPSFGLLGATMDTTYHYSDLTIEMEEVLINDHTIDVYKRDQSLLGTAVLSDYSMIIDFRKKNLYLKPAAQEVERKTTDGKEFGFYMYYDPSSSKCFVASLDEGSSAAISGLQLKDTIVAINGQKIPAFNNYCEFREWNRKLNAQNTVMIKTTRDDQIIKIEKGIIPKR